MGIALFWHVAPPQSDQAPINANIGENERLNVPPPTGEPLF
jgi:hypothetical protein